LPCWDAGWVSGKAADYRHDHQRLIGSVLEVFVPCCLEVSAQRLDIGVRGPKFALHVNAIPAQEWVILRDQVSNVDSACKEPIHCLVWPDTSFVRIEHDVVVLKNEKSAIWVSETLRV
jgi:hypothetical protein